MKIACKTTYKYKKKFEILRSPGPHNPEVVGSSPASATNIANRKRYRFEKPRNHSGFGVLLCHFLR